MLPDERPHYPFVEELPKRLGGARKKSVFLDSAGRQWLFKPQSLAQTTVDVVAAAVARTAGVPSPAVYDAEFTWQEERRLGSVQPYIATQKDGLERDLSVLTDEQRRELQRHQVVDWLLGNVDAHREQFILLADGTIAGVDKSQALRVLPHDRLEWDFCLWPINNRQPVYSYLFQGAQQGRYVLRPQVAIDFADEVTRRLSNDWFRKIWRPVVAQWPFSRLAFACGLQRLDSHSQMIEAVLDHLEKRKNRLPEQFEALYYARSQNLWQDR